MKLTGRAASQLEMKHENDISIGPKSTNNIAIKTLYNPGSFTINNPYTS